MSQTAFCIMAVLSIIALGEATTQNSSATERKRVVAEFAIRGVRAIGRNRRRNVAPTAVRGATTATIVRCDDAFPKTVL